MKPWMIITVIGLAVVAWLWLRAKDAGRNKMLKRSENDLQQATKTASGSIGDYRPQAYVPLTTDLHPEISLSPSSIEARRIAGK